MEYTLLVVDDEEIMRKNIVRATSETGCFNVLSARNAKEAKTIIIKRKIHAMLLDIAMPGQTGIELLNELKQQGIALPLTAIISGYDTFEYARQAIGLSVVDYVLKPVDSEDIRKLCAALMEKLTPETKTDEAARARKFSRLVVDIQNYIQSNYARDISVSGISQELNFSPNYAGRIFKEQTGLSILDYITMVRIENAKELMSRTDALVYEVAYEVGFNDQRYFSTVFKKHVGQSPRDYILSLK